MPRRRRARRASGRASSDAADERRTTRAGRTPAESPAASPHERRGAAAVDWVAEVWIDPAWYEAQDSPDPLPSPGLPDVVPLRSTSVLVGRKSVSRNINPEIDCGNDSGVSRRQAQMTTDGRRWFVEDLDSANGTFVGPASGALPDRPDRRRHQARARCRRPRLRRRLDPVGHPRGHRGREGLAGLAARHIERSRASRRRPSRPARRRARCAPRTPARRGAEQSPAPGPGWFP